MSTVLPTPAPPNRPILPPRTKGSRRSMTLKPVRPPWRSCCTRCCPASPAGELGRPLARHAAPPARGVPPGGVMLALAAVAAGIGYLAAGPQAALGAACGGIVAYGYSWSFLRGHLARTTRGPGLDAALAGGAMTRLV